MLWCEHFDLRGHGRVGVELVIWVVIIIIVDVLNQYWVGCSDGLAMWCWWWLR
jgi:hypothetical protein